MTHDHKAWVQRLFDLWMSGKDDEVRSEIGLRMSRVVLGLRHEVLLYEMLTRKTGEEHQRGTESN